MTVKQIAGVRWRVARDGKSESKCFGIDIQQGGFGWGFEVQGLDIDDPVLFVGSTGKSDGPEATAETSLRGLDELISILQDLRGVTAQPEAPLVRALRKLCATWDRRADALETELQADQNAEEVRRCRAELEALL